MEMRSELGFLSGRESFSISVPKSSVNSQQAMQNMQLIYAPDHTPIYKPLTSASPPAPPPPYQGGGAGAVAGDGASPAVPPHGLNISLGESVKRKRGRPRKYGPDGGMALAPTPVSSASPMTPVTGAGAFSPSLAGSTKPASSTPSKSNKKRGRPLGSGKKQQMAFLGSAGLGFTPHIITVNAGEDMSSKILSFSQHGSCAVCILSANGAVSDVTLRQAATSGGTVTYQGRFEILSLSGSFLLSESGGHRSRTGGLSVSLASPDGHVLGGGVAGPLTAASPVQVVVGSFIVDGKKEPKQTPHSDPTSMPGNLGAGATARASSPPSRSTLGESAGSPASPLNPSAGACNNSNQQGLPTMPWK